MKKKKIMKKSSSRYMQAIVRAELAKTRPVKKG